MIELKGENSQQLAQIDRLNEQLVVLKSELNSLHSNRLALEQKLTQISDKNQMENSVNNNIYSQIMQINSKIESLTQYLHSIESIQNELKNSGIFR